MMDTAVEEARQRGDAAVSAGDHAAAVVHYSQALSVAATAGLPPDKRLYAARSVSHLRVAQDADSVTEPPLTSPTADPGGAATAAAPEAGGTPTAATAAAAAAASAAGRRSPAAAAAVQRAVADGAAAADIDPTWPTGWLATSAALRFAHQPAAAVAVLRRGASHAPADGDLAAALTDALAAERAQPRSTAARLRGNAAYRRGDDRAAVGAYTASLAAAAADGEWPDKRVLANRSAAWLRLAIEADDEAALEAAADDAAAALRIDPTWAKAWHRRVVALLEASRFGDARRALGQGLQLCPGDDLLLRDADAVDAAEREWASLPEEIRGGGKGKKGDGRFAAAAAAAAAAATAATGGGGGGSGMGAAPRSPPPAPSASAPYPERGDAINPSRSPSPVGAGGEATAGSRSGSGDAGGGDVPPPPERGSWRKGLTNIIDSDGDSIDDDVDPPRSFNSAAGLGRQPPKGDTAAAAANGGGNADHPARLPGGRIGRSGRPIKETGLYDVLGVRADATDAAIKRAYYLRAKAVHPDRNPGDDGATAAFQALGDAYAALSSPTTREIYDAGGAAAVADAADGLDPDLDSGGSSGGGGGGVGGGDGPVNAAALFDTLFGSDAFECLVGPLRLASLAAHVDDEGRPPSARLLATLERERVRELTVSLVRMLDPWVAGDQSAFRSWAATKASCLATATAGAALLHTVGTAYVRQAEMAAGRRRLLGLPAAVVSVGHSTSRLTAQVRAHGAAARVVDRQRRLASRVRKAELGGDPIGEAEAARLASEMVSNAYDMMWRITVLDVQDTLDAVCRAVLSGADLAPPPGLSVEEEGEDGDGAGAKGAKASSGKSSQAAAKQPATPSVYASEGVRARGRSAILAARASGVRLFGKALLAEAGRQTRRDASRDAEAGAATAAATAEAAAMAAAAAAAASGGGAAADGQGGASYTAGRAGDSSSDDDGEYAVPPLYAQAT